MSYKIGKKQNSVKTRDEETEEVKGGQSKENNVQIDRN